MKSSIIFINQFHSIEVNEGISLNLKQWFIEIMKNEHILIINFRYIYK